MTGSHNVGLGFATALAVSNVVMDVLRKKALQPNDLYSVSFWLRAVSTLCFGLAFGVEVFRHGIPVLHSNGPLFGIAGAEWPEAVQFLVYLWLDAAMVALALLFYLRALQTAELSYFLPFMSLTLRC